MNPMLQWSRSACWAGADRQQCHQAGSLSFSLGLYPSISQAYSPKAPLQNASPATLLATLSSFTRSDLASSTYIFGGLFPCSSNLPEWRVITKLLPQTPVKQRESHSSSHDRDQIGHSVIMRKPLLHFHRHPGTRTRQRERERLTLQKDHPTHTHTDYHGKSSFSRKGCEHPEHGGEGARYRKGGVCTGQGDAAWTLKENSQSKSKI